MPGQHLEPGMRAYLEEENRRRRQQVPPPRPERKGLKQRKKKQKKRARQFVFLPDPLPPLLNKAELCAVLKYSYPTIWRLIRAGNSPRAIDLGTAGKSLRWHRDEVLGWLKERPLMQARPEHQAISQRRDENRAIAQPRVAERAPRT